MNHGVSLRGGSTSSSTVWSVEQVAVVLVVVVQVAVVVHVGCMKLYVEPPTVGRHWVQPGSMWAWSVPESPYPLRYLPMNSVS